MPNARRQIDRRRIGVRFVGQGSGGLVHGPEDDSVDAVLERGRGVEDIWRCCIVVEVLPEHHAGQAARRASHPVPVEPLANRLSDRSIRRVNRWKRRHRANPSPRNKLKFRDLLRQTVEADFVAPFQRTADHAESPTAGIDPI